MCSSHYICPLIICCVFLCALCFLVATVLLSFAALELEGDLVETGVFTGGTAAMMMRVLMTYDECDRKLYAFDSFDGLPTPSESDRRGGGNAGKRGSYNASLNTFINNLHVLGGWDDKRIVISKGWFKDTCAVSPVSKISFLRLDGDLYSSTWDAIDALYDRVVPGGFIYVDDYASFNGCKRAIDEFRLKRKITAPMHIIPENLPRYNDRYEAVWWQKPV